MRDADIDQIAERARRRLDRRGRVLDVQVEDDARVPLARPGQERLVVLFDEPDRPVDDVRVAAAERAARIFHERMKAPARDIDLRNHLGRLDTRPQRAVEIRMVVVDVGCR